MIGFPPSATICLSTANERRFSWFFCGCCSFSYILLLFFFSIFYCFPSVCVWLYHLSNCLPQSKLCDDYFIHLTVWTVQLFSNSNSHPLKTIIILFYFFLCYWPRILQNCSKLFQRRITTKKCSENAPELLWNCSGNPLRVTEFALGLLDATTCVFHRLAARNYRGENKREVNDYLKAFYNSNDFKDNLNSTNRVFNWAALKAFRMQWIRFVWIVTAFFADILLVDMSDKASKTVQ